MGQILYLLFTLDTFCISHTFCHGYDQILDRCHSEEEGFILVCGLKEVYFTSPGEGLLAGVAPSCGHESFLTQSGEYWHCSGFLFIILNS